MNDLERLQKLYVTARNAAIEGKEEALVCNNLSEISKYLKNLAKISSYYDAIKCIVKAESIENFIQYVKINGLSDKKVSIFFGLSKPMEGAPTFEQIMTGNAVMEKPIIKNKSTPAQSFSAEAEENTMDDLIDSILEKKDSNQEEPQNNDPCVDLRKETSLSSKECVPADESFYETDQDKRHFNAGSFTPQCLDDFIGQEHVIKRIKQEIYAAKKLGKKHIDNILLFGTRGLGKSTLMKLIAKELGVDFRFMDASAFNNDVASQRKLHKFFMNICDYGKPVVIAFDEIHAMPKQIQTALLTLLNDRVYSYMDNNGMTQNIPINEFTFIGATTDADKVLPTIKDRCNNLTFFLKDYAREELEKIFRIKFGAYNLTVDNRVLDDCIKRCRSSIREVESFVNGLRTKAINLDTNTITKEMANEYFKERELDAIGLRVKDLEILDLLAHDPVGIMAAETLAAKAHLDTGVYMSEFEPYLIKLGFINISNRGRGLSEKGKRYLMPEAYAGESDMDVCDEETKYSTSEDSGT